MKNIEYTETTHEMVVQNAVDALAMGKTIVYPTDTVYGLGADATRAEAVHAVHEIKGRDAKKPILALVADAEMMSMYATMTPLAVSLAEEFLPGPLTLVLQTKDERLAAIASPDGTVGFRIPHHSFCIDVACRFGRPLTSTSTNRAGKQQPNTLKGMLEQLGSATGGLDLIVCAGDVSRNTPSTIIDARGDRAVVLREGALGLSAVARYL